MEPSGAIKSLVRQRFGQFASSYVSASGHSKGADLDRLAELSGVTENARVLDVATGGGHTALRMSQRAGDVTALDLTIPMLQAARAFISGQGASVRFIAGDAEALPFASGFFDLVTCRIAPHHFPDCFRFVQECARVVRPGGRVLIEDQLVPDDPRAARYIDSFERLRDPAHYRIYAAYEWEGLFLDTGLQVEHVESLVKEGVALVPWAEVQGCDAVTIDRLRILLAQAPAAAADWLQPRCPTAPDASFTHHYILISGTRPPG